MAKASDRRVKTADRVFEIIEVVQNEDHATLNDIAKSLDIAKSTAHVYVTTLLDLGYLRKADDSYEIGLRFLDHGIYARNRLEVMRVGHEPLQQLADGTGECAWLIVECNGKAIYLDKATGDQAIQTYARVGMDSHLHCLASGKAILANLPWDRVEEIIEIHGLPEMTENTLTTREELFKDLEQIRDKGYAINKSEASVGSRSIGVPIMVENEVRGAISVSGPSNRLSIPQTEDKIIKSVLSTANEIELKIAQRSS